MPLYDEKSARVMPCAATIGVFAAAAMSPGSALVALESESPEMPESDLPPLVADPSDAPEVPAEDVPEVAPDDPLDEPLAEPVLASPLDPAPELEPELLPEPPLPSVEPSGNSVPLSPRLPLLHAPATPTKHTPHTASAR